MNPTYMQCPDCGSCRRGDGYNRDGWYWLECGRRYNPDTDGYSPPNFYCKTIQLEAECESLGGDFEELHNACLEYLKSPPSNVPARRKFAEIVTGGSTAHLQSVRIEVDTEQHECDWEFVVPYYKGAEKVFIVCRHKDCKMVLTKKMAVAMLNEVGPLKEMLDELIDCHYGIKDSPSKEMAEKIRAYYWKPNLRRERD